MRQIGYRYQRTVARAVSVRGTGFVTGSPVRVRLVPAPEDTGLVFVRTDLPYRPLTPAVASRVTNTARRTTLGTIETGVTLVEHVLAALAGSRVTNCVIELDGVEPPGLDGSSAGFVEAIDQAGVVTQSARHPVYTPDEPVVVSHGGATIALHPSLDDDLQLRASYILDYGPRAPIPRQSVTTEITTETVRRDLAHCRTFLLEREAHELKRLGVGRHLTASELLVFGPRGVIGNRLRHGDEPARHKVLDLVGDLALCGFDLAGHVVAYRSGHALNVALARTLVERVESTRSLPFPDLVFPTGRPLPVGHEAQDPIPLRAAWTGRRAA